MHIHNVYVTKLAQKQLNKLVNCARKRTKPPPPMPDYLGREGEFGGGGGGGGEARETGLAVGAGRGGAG